MNSTILYLIIATAVTLIIGILLMAIGGNLDKKYSSKLMTLRVILQALAVILLAFLYSAHKTSS